MLPLSTAVPACLPPCPTASPVPLLLPCWGLCLCGSPVTPPRDTISVEMNPCLMSPFKAIGPLTWLRTWLHGQVWKHKGEEWQVGKLKQEV